MSRLFDPDFPPDERADASFMAAAIAYGTFKIASLLR